MNSSIPRRWSALDAFVVAMAGWLAVCSPARGQDSKPATSQPESEPAMTTTAPHKFTNRLIHATSPYLVQHAHNPVDWYEWGPEALKRAKDEHKPIFLSIGYSACHWCHVMERECFENEDIAAYMNEHFVNIKVDREERPDLDDIYMTATQALTGSGGWPMSVWLTSDLKPFYAGTYFPPEDRYGRPGFKRLLEYLADKWKTDQETVVLQSEQLAAAIRRYVVVEPGKTDVPHKIVIETARTLANAFDPLDGGVSGGGTNKFPPSMALDLMLRACHHAESGAEGALAPADRKRLMELVELTLDKMAGGGIFDHLGGGIHRYSTDVKWLVPHFEKMLYDQALVSSVYLDAYRATGKPLYARVARDIFDYVIADLQSPEGGFYSSRDADSEGVEGKFYVWSHKEVLDALGESEGRLFCDYYDVSEVGNWEGHNILNVPRPAEIVARLNKIGAEELDRRLAAARNRLFEVRERRVKPHLDDKVLASWSGLMIAGMARGYRILGETRYRDAAVRAADFVLGKMVREGRLHRTWRGGRTHTPGYLDDYAFMIEALLNLYETTFDVRWLDRAAELNDGLMKHYRDAEHGGFFFTADYAEKVLVRAKEANDAAVPSGNSVQLMNLLRLSVLLDRKDLAEEAEKVIRVFSAQVNQSPHRSERMLSALDFYHRRPKEIAFVAEAPTDAAHAALVTAAWRTYVPNAVFACLLTQAPDAKALERKVPLLAGKKPLDGKPAAYVCRNFACQFPTSDPEELKRQISR